MRRVVSSIAIALMLGWSGVVAAEELPPWSGTLVGRNDGDILRYECKETASTRISCDFVQVMLTNGANETKYNSRIENIPEMISQEFHRQLCEIYAVYAAALDGRPLDTSEMVDEMADEARQIFDATSALLGWARPERITREKEAAEAFGLFCATPNAETAKALIDTQYRQEQETCAPFFNVYSQEFQRVSANVWTVVSTPSGTCGVVNTSRFWRKREDGGSLWNYEASKVVTNKSGEGILPCADLIEEPQPYNWGDGPIYHNCRFFD